METSAWFDYNGYMSNKLAKLQKEDSAGNWDMVKVVKAFADAGFAGAEGAEAHFMQYGQFEDVAPNAFFNATEYYRAKAALFFDKEDDPKSVTDLEVAYIQVAIKDAGMSAWSHYQQHGTSENVNPSNGFDTEAYMNAKLLALNAIPDGKQYTLPEVYEAFKAAGLSALEHFMIYGGNSEAGEVTQKYENGKIPPAFAVPEEKKVNPSEENVGKTSPLTTGFDDLPGTAGNDAYIASVVGTAATLNLGDKINGGEGTDTLKIYAGAGSENFAGADISNVEIVRMVASTTGEVIDVSTNADVQELWFDGGTMGTATLSVEQKLGFSGDVTAGTIKFTGVDGDNDSVTLAFDKATLTGMTVAAIENLTFEVAGTNDIGTVTAASAASLVVTGNGELDVTVTGATGMASVDTTGFDGDLFLKFDDAVAATFAYTGGAGNDDLTLAAHTEANYNINLGAGADTLTLGTNTATTFASTAKIDGGDGYDTLVIGTAYTAADFKLFSNFEGLVLGAGIEQDVSLFSGADIFVDATAAATFTIANLRADQDLTLTGSAATVVMKYDSSVGAAPDRTVDLILDDMDADATTGVTLAAFSEDTSTTIKTLNITSEDAAVGGTAGVSADANVISSVSGATGLKTINIDGDSNLHFTTEAVGSLTVDAHAFTGNLIFDGSDATGALTVTGGSGNDHITGSSKADYLVGGDGNDTIVAGTVTITGTPEKWDVLAGGKGIDTFNVAGITSAGTEIANIKGAMVTIEDFEKGETITMTATTAAAISKYDGSETTLDAIVTAIAGGTAAVSVTWFELDGHTYVVNNCATGASAGAGIDVTDQVIKLVGDHDLSDATFNTTNDTLTW